MELIQKQKKNYDFCWIKKFFNNFLILIDITVIKDWILFASHLKIVCFKLFSFLQKKYLLGEMNKPRLVYNNYFLTF